MAPAAVLQLLVMPVVLVGVAAPVVGAGGFEDEDDTMAGIDFDAVPPEDLQGLQEALSVYSTGKVNKSEDHKDNKRKLGLVWSKVKGKQRRSP